MASSSLSAPSTWHGPSLTQRTTSMEVDHMLLWRLSLTVLESSYLFIRWWLTFGWSICLRSGMESVARRSSDVGWSDPALCLGHFLVHRGSVGAWEPGGAWDFMWGAGSPEQDLGKSWPLQASSVTCDWNARFGADSKLCEDGCRKGLLYIHSTQACGVPVEWVLLPHLR